jgi:hypothetical protein
MDLARTRYVAEHFEHLQGLRLVPLGVCFLLSAARGAGFLSWVPGTQGRGADVWFLGVVAAAAVATDWVTAWYGRHMGVARARPSRSGAVTLVLSCVAFVVWVALPPNPWHVSPALCFLAAVLAFQGCAPHGLRRHYLPIALVWLLFALTPAIGMPGAVRRVAFDALIGLGLIVAGVGDHRVLQRSIRESAGVWDGRAT